MIPTRRALAAGLAAFVASAGAAAAQQQTQRKPDLADVVAGAYAGSVISDSRGSSRSGVALTITRTGPNTVEISSNYNRLPKITVPLMAAMDKIVQRNGDSAFVYDPAAQQLDVSFNNEVSWSGNKR